MENKMSNIELADFQLSLKMLSAQADICSHFATPESICSTSFINTFSDLKNCICDVLEKIAPLRTDKNIKKWSQFIKGNENHELQ